LRLSLVQFEVGRMWLSDGTGFPGLRLLSTNKLGEKGYVPKQFAVRDSRN